MTAASRLEDRIREQLGVQDALDPQNALEHQRTQGDIARRVIWLLIAVVIALVAAYLLAPLSSAADHITAAAEKARDVANTLVLPIVTLVLGYYFGKRGE